MLTAGRNLSLQERSLILLRFADLIEKHNDEIAALETWDNGKPYEQAVQIEVPMVARLMRYYAGDCLIFYIKWFSSTIQHTYMSDSFPFFYLQVGLIRSMGSLCRLTDHTMYRYCTSQLALQVRSSHGTSHCWCLPGKLALLWHVGTLLCSRLLNKLLFRPCTSPSCCMRLVQLISCFVFVLLVREVN